MIEHQPPSLPGTVTLMGSGEMTDPMSRTYRAVISRITGPVRPVFLDTPAGFQLNADEISERAAAYFQQHFQLQLAIASFKGTEDSSVEQEERARRWIRRANLIFAGPGSPTYAVQIWKDSALFEGVRSRLAEGAHLVFSSAAAIAMSRFTLPVYEIYKVGKPPHWVEGVDLLAPYGLELAILPHWNNAEGGTHDTRFCFMGKPRLRRLEDQLPPSTTLLGIDEYTACILDLARGEGSVMGAGGITLRCRVRERSFASGTSFPLNALRSLGTETSPWEASRVESPRPNPSQVIHRLEEALGQTQQLLASSTRQDHDVVLLASQLLKLARVMEEAREGGVEGEPIQQAKDGFRGALALWEGWLNGSSDELRSEIGPWVDLLVQIRSRLREAKQWALADEIRSRLSSMGIILEDASEGTRWHRSS